MSRGVVMRVLSVVIFCSVVVFGLLPEVSITVLSQDIQLLEQDPFFAEDIQGTFIGGDGVQHDTIDVNYRGAWRLGHLIDNGFTQRNWKVKVHKENQYRNRREWNYNYEDHPRQVLAYALMSKAGVAAASCRSVVLSVNGKQQGLYIEFEDPDNKNWLADKFGDNDGDLFKAAFDVPNEQRYFATLEDLGDTADDYYWHYRKKTNHKDAGASDYRSIISFIKVINDTPDDQFVETLKKNFDTDAFIKYLVVSNFISNWDSYPVRPKNFWLYQNPLDSQWTFIPWDLDATFQPYTFNLNKMGATASIFYQFDGYEPYEKQDDEGEARPLITRMMQFDEFRGAYIEEYIGAMETYLSKDMMYDLLDSLEREVNQTNALKDKGAFSNAITEIKEFVTTKTTSVTQQLSPYVIELSSPDESSSQEGSDISPLYDFSKMTNGTGSVEVTVYTLFGERIARSMKQVGELDVVSQSLNVNTYLPGVYVVTVRSVSGMQSSVISVK